MVATHVNNVGQQLLAAQRFHAICLLVQQRIGPLDLARARLELQPRLFLVDLSPRGLLAVFLVLLPAVLLLPHGLERVGPLRRTLLRLEPDLLPPSLAVALHGRRDARHHALQLVR